MRPLSASGKACQLATLTASSSAPDSITVGNGSVWVEYGNGASSTGGPGSSTIVQYSPAGSIQSTYTIAGSVDGLKIDPSTGLVWALQNQDANSTLSLINPTTHAITGPLSYASPPYVYGANSSRGYDDVAFRGSQVFLSYTNSTGASDPVVQLLNQGHAPSGTLTTTDVVIAGQTGVPTPDTDSLKTAPDRNLVLTDGDGGRVALISNPGSAGQTISNVQIKAGGTNVSGLDDVLFPSATSETLYVSDTANNDVFAVSLTGLDLNPPIASIGSLQELALVDTTTGNATPLLTAAGVPTGKFTSPHGLDFAPTAVPEPFSLSILGTGIIGLSLVRRRRVSR